MVALITAICNFISILLLWIWISGLNRKINSVKMELLQKIHDDKMELSRKISDVNRDFDNNKGIYQQIKDCWDVFQVIECKVESRVFKRMKRQKFELPILPQKEIYEIKMDDSGRYYKEVHIAKMVGRTLDDIVIVDERGVEHKMKEDEYYRFDEYFADKKVKELNREK